MKSTSSIVLQLLGTLLLAAAILKGGQLLTEPVADSDIWWSRPFLIFQVEFELALAIWLLSGLFRKAAWLAVLLCFSLFSFVTLYKGLTGAASCGCFGSVHVNPWITLLAIDLPAVILLLIFRPRFASPLVLASCPHDSLPSPQGSLPCPQDSLPSPQGSLPCPQDSLPPRQDSWPFALRFLSFLRKQESIKALIREFLAPIPSLPRLAATAGVGLLILAVTTPILALNEPAAVTSSYEVLEPETWAGKELPILECIDIAERLKTGNWLILLYHHDCPDCSEAIRKYEQMARDLAGNGDFLRIALIEMPPYGPPLAPADSACTIGRLANAKEWFVTTPAVALLTDGTVNQAWEAKAPNFDTVISKIVSMAEKEPLAKTVVFHHSCHQQENTRELERR